MECPLVLSEDIGCHSLLSLILSIFEMISNCDFKSIKTLHRWYSNKNSERMNNLLHGLHQYMTLTLTIKEDEIEDLSDEWRVELKYDETEDTDERDEIQQQIEKRQQSEREKYVKDQIAAAVKFVDILYVSNKLIIAQTAKEKQEEEDKDGDIKMDKDEESDDKLRRVSLVGIDSLAIAKLKPVEM